MWLWVGLAGIGLWGPSLPERHCRVGFAPTGKAGLSAARCKVDYTFCEVDITSGGGTARSLDELATQRGFLENQSEGDESGDRHAPGIPRVRDSPAAMQSLRRCGERESARGSGAEPSPSSIPTYSPSAPRSKWNAVQQGQAAAEGHPGQHRGPDQPDGGACQRLRRTPAEHMPGARSSRIDRKISGIGPRSRALQWG